MQTDKQCPSNRPCTVIIQKSRAKTNVEARRIEVKVKTFIIYPSYTL